MDSSAGVGLIAVLAVSGGVVMVALQLHKRLLSDFMKKLELELAGPAKCQSTKKVRFADNVDEPSSNNKEYRRSRIPAKINRIPAMVHGRNRDLDEESEDTMPLNRRALYRGITEYKILEGYTVC